jgi:putative DNA methylase
LIEAAGRGETALAGLIAKLGHEADIARELAYRLYALSERKKWTEEASWYNGLVQSWPEAVRLAADVRVEMPVQGQLFGEA